MGSAVRSMPNLHRVALAVAVLFAASFVPLPQARACPFCPAALMTLSEQLEQANAAALGQWVCADKATEDKRGASTFQLRQMVKGPKALAKGLEVTADGYQAAKPGELFFLLGFEVDKGAELIWGTALPVTEASFNYIAQAPPRDAPPATRLPYYLKFLEDANPQVSNDAFAEFANAEYEDVERLSPQLPTEKIRRWIADPQTPATRLGLYGMMLGLCGNDADAAELERRILLEPSEFRLGIDGLIGGYLLLRRERGLDVLDQRNLQNRKAAFSEVFAAMQALRFMWTYGKTRIAPERLQQSMRILLERPEMTDLVIADLARWKDWSIQDKLMAMYGQGEFDTPAIRLAIVRYMLVSCEADTTRSDATPPLHARHGKKLLEELRRKDSPTVAKAERFFVVP